MKSIAVWSLSNHFQKKVLPSIAENKKIKITSILTKKNTNNLDFKGINIYNNKKIFFKDNFDYVYISSVNSKHYQNCKFALENKKNVICEKPICLKKRQLNILKKIAKKNKKIFFEVAQYVHHPLFIRLKKLINQNEIGKVTNVDCKFKIPLNEKKNFRFIKKLGGGALYDVGYYPISMIYNLFDSKKVKILNSNLKRQHGIDVNGKIKVQNEKKVMFNLEWGFKGLYENNIKIYGKDGYIDVNFIFSKKIIQDGQIKIFKNKDRTIKINKSNQINLAFQKMLLGDKMLFNREFKTSMKILDMIEKLQKI